MAHLAGGYRGGKRASAGRPGESTLKIRAPRGKTGAVLVQTKDRLEPKDVDFLAAKLRPVGRMPVIIATPFLTARTRQRLKASGLGYADLTGKKTERGAVQIGRKGRKCVVKPQKRTSGKHSADRGGRLKRLPWRIFGLR
jgi:hypothetical protein